jgi:transcriptional regulator with XRE-family HTH domain
MNTGNLISSRQLRAARALAGLTQAQLATQAGFNREACQYWESRGDGLPTSTQSTLDAITAALGRHGVVLFCEPTAGARLA